MEFDIWTLVSAVLGLVAIVAGGFWARAKGLLSKLAKLVKETVDVIDAVVLALEDNKLTKEEVEEIKKHALELKGAWKALFNK